MGGPERKRSSSGKAKLKQQALDDFSLLFNLARRRGTLVPGRRPCRLSPTQRPAGRGTQCPAPIKSRVWCARNGSAKQNMVCSVCISVFVSVCARIKIIWQSARGQMCSCGRAACQAARPLSLYRINGGVSSEDFWQSSKVLVLSSFEEHAIVRMREKRTARPNLARFASHIGIGLMRSWYMYRKVVALA